MTETMDSLIDIFDDASAIYKGETPVARIQQGRKVIFDKWPDCTISVIKDEHVHGVESTTVPYGGSYQSDEITADAGYCIKSVEVLME